MARSAPKTDEAAKAGRGVTRTIVNWIVLGASIAILIGWVYQGRINLAPGESAVILRMGEFNRIRDIEGWWLHMPPPLESHDVVNTSRLRTQSFGSRPTHSTPGEPTNADD